MPLPNPCSCISLQLGSKPVSGVAILIGAIRIMLYIIDIVDLKRTYGAYATGHPLLTILIICLMVQIASILASIILFMGASKGNINYLLMWLVVTGIVMCNEFLGAIRNDLWAYASFFLDFYFMWVVYAFKTQLLQTNTGGPANHVSV